MDIIKIQRHIDESWFMKNWKIKYTCILPNINKLMITRNELDILSHNFSRVTNRLVKPKRI